MAMSQLFLFPNSARHDPAVAAWWKEHPGEFGVIARRWFEVMRGCVDDVHELLHDGHPTACAEDAAFGYVNAFKAHVNVGFFQGSALPDPAHLMEGDGKRMRHVKLTPGTQIDVVALTQLIHAAYIDMKRRLQAEASPSPRERV